MINLDPSNQISVVWGAAPEHQAAVLLEARSSRTQVLSLGNPHIPSNILFDPFLQTNSPRSWGPSFNAQVVPIAPPAPNHQSPVVEPAKPARGKSADPIDPVTIGLLAHILRWAQILLAWHPPQPPLKWRPNRVSGFLSQFCGRGGKIPLRWSMKSALNSDREPSSF